MLDVLGAEIMCTFSANVSTIMKILRVFRKASHPLQNKTTVFPMRLGGGGEQIQGTTDSGGFPAET